MYYMWLWVVVAYCTTGGAGCGTEGVARRGAACRAVFCSAASGGSAAIGILSQGIACQWSCKCKRPPIAFLNSPLPVFTFFPHLREQAASYYNPWGYGLILNMVEMPYQLVQVHTCVGDVWGLRTQQRAGHSGEQRAVEIRAQQRAGHSGKQGAAESRA